MFWKTAKDELIEYLRAELVHERLRSEEAAQAAWEAVQLAKTAIALLPEDKKNAALVTDNPPRPRTMSAWCASLSERSYKRAQSNGKNLVAEMPPPGAIKSAGD